MQFSWHSFPLVHNSLEKAFDLADIKIAHAYESYACSKTKLACILIKHKLVQSEFCTDSGVFRMVSNICLTTVVAS